jgi:hypothetical protein
MPHQKEMHMKLVATLLAVGMVLGVCGFLNANVTNVTVSPQGTGGVLDNDGYIVTVYKDFNPIVGLGPVDVNITVNGSGAVVLAESDSNLNGGFIHNNTGQTWKDFHFQILGDATFYGFLNDAFAGVTMTPSKIDLYNGLVAWGDNFHADLNIFAPGPGTFTVREWASVDGGPPVPEPITLSMLALSGIGLARYAVRRWRTGN